MIVTYVIRSEIAIPFINMNSEFIIAANTMEKLIYLLLIKWTGPSSRKMLIRV